MRAVFDSVIIIDLLNGRPEAAAHVKLYEPVISTVTYAEVLAGSIKRSTYAEVLGFLKTMEIVAFDTTIAELAAQIRAEKGIKLPDAIIYSTAKALGLVLVTRNTKDFDKSDVNMRIPYQIS